MNIKQILSPGRVKVKAGEAPTPRQLLGWYDRHQRILPWRALPGRVQDPYRVWLSEVMLQQTTVAAVGPYYQRFLKRWPSIEKLAQASPDEVRRLWAGLGYYRRAQLLHDCAVKIFKEYGGQLPETEAELMELPGFGAYTAAAVASIAFNRRANVIDGNVERVMARIFAIRTPLPQAKAKIRRAAATLLPSSRYGDYAQALMDLGATICTSRNPKCALCPWARGCRGRREGIADTLPLRVKKKAKPVRRAIAFVLTNPEGKILLRQRPQNGLLAGMMEIPSSLWREGAMPVLREVKTEAPVNAKWKVVPGVVRHVFSHFELEVAVAVASTTRKVHGNWVMPQQLKKEALPSVMRKIVSHVPGLI